MTCGSCGTRLPSDAVFCPRCGTRLPVPCAVCGSPNAPGSRLCKHCGQPLAARAPSAEEPPADSAERRQLTVLFCDLVGSTELSSRVDPERLREVVRAYQAAAAEAIERFEGHVAQYLGDGVLAYFGFPRAHEDDAERAVRAGLATLEAIHALGKQHEHAWGYGPSVRIGIHTGLTVVGEVGGGARREQLAVGEAPNLAARLQALAEPGTLLISASTRRLLHGRFLCQHLGSQSVKGVTRPVQVYRVAGESQADDRVELGARPLVGREQELGVLAGRWEEARDEGQVVLITGEPGIGKSRLVEALRERIAGAHVRWECRCSPYHQQSALRPWIELAERAFAFVPEEGPAERLRKIEAGLAPYGLADPVTLDLWAALLSVPRTDDVQPSVRLTPKRRRQRTFDAIARLLLATAARSPVLLVVEDLHWADPSTLELLGVLVDQVPARALILLTARPEFLPPWEQRSHVTVVTLGRLAGLCTREMIQQLAGEDSLPAELFDQLVARSDGVPLFAEELTKSVLESDGSDGPLAIPATLRESLMARLDRLGPAKAVAQLAATLGRQFSYELLHAVSPVDEESLEHELARLVGAELLVPHGLAPDAGYVFKHILIQEAAYESLLLSTRSRHHARIATVLAEQFPKAIEAQPELLAQHLMAAGRPVEAIEHWRRAGLLAIQRSANLEAIHHLERALEALGSEQTPERDQLEIGLLTALGPVLIATRGWSAPEVGRSYGRARDLCRRAGEAPQLFTVLWGLWFYYVTSGRLQTARELGEQLMGLAVRQSDPGLVMQAHHMLGPTLLSLGSLTSARSHFEAAIALYDRDRHRSHASLYGGHDPCVCCSAMGARAHWILGFPDLALRRAREAIELARALEHPASLAWALSYTAMLHQLRQEPEAARDVATEGLTVAAEYDLSSPHMICRFTRGWALARAHDEGLAALHEARAALAASGQRIWEPHFLGMVAEVCHEPAEVEYGLAAVDEGLATVAETGDCYYEAELHRLRGELVLLQRGATVFAEADACFRRAFEVARKQEARAWELRAAMSLVRLSRDRDGHGAASRVLADATASFSEGFDTKDLRDARELLRRV